VSSVSRQNTLTHELRKIAKNMIVLPVGLLILFAVYFIIIVSLHNWVIANIVVTVTSLVVSIFSLALTMIIAIKQSEVMEKQSSQLDTLDKLNEQLRARKAADDRVNKLFFPTGKRRRFTCIMPVEYARRPLPTIAAGDYYAWHVMQNCIDESNMEVILTNPHDDRNAPIQIPNGDIIFMCSPQVNAYLDKLAPYLELSGDYVASGPGDRGVDAKNKGTLPFWFCSRPRIINSDNNPISWIDKLICLFPGCGNNSLEDVDHLDVIRSPAEDAYFAASLLGPGEAPKKGGGLKQDYAVIMRLSRRHFHLERTAIDDEDAKIIVIAGIHQYGTWIAGDFISKYRTGRMKEVDDLFESSEDFALIIEGWFNENTLIVEADKVHAVHRFRYVDSRWVNYTGTYRDTMQDPVS